MKKSLPSIGELISNYEEKVKPTDKKLDSKEIHPVLFGLFSEVGSLMNTYKKLRREDIAFPRYSDNVKEELGDVLWYLAALCRRLDTKLPNIFLKTLGPEATSKRDAMIAATGEIDDFALRSILLRLGEQSGQLIQVAANDPKKIESEADKLLASFVQVYIEAVHVSRMLLDDVIEENINKTRGRFIEPTPDELSKINFDDKYPEDEQLPRKFEIEIVKRRSGQYYLRWNGVFIGSPLSDDNKDEDDYRFHDVFHLSYAAILHWSPSLRDLINHRRKSKKDIDKAEDSFRPRVIDEGLSAYIFSYAKDLNFFEGHETVSFDLLKDIQNFVKGYEVAACPLYLWEQAIIQGYTVWRSIRDNDGGIVVGNRNKRTLTYKHLTGKNK